jgi:hypothetical protein
MQNRRTTYSLPLCALLVALVMNLVNLFEPLTVDDVCHHYYAAQVARAPLQPFEFDVVWHQKPEAAWNVMVAPVNSYYWAPAIALFGDAPVAWKAWYLPLQWLFCYALLCLLQRLVRRHAVALLATIALGPAVLPGVNLMLEVPMLAFAFAGFAVLLRSFERRHLGLAALAGLLFGLAFQTKYSAMGFFAPWCLSGLVFRRWRELALGLAVAVSTALAIEGLVAWSHGGGSYFMRQLEITQRRDWAHLLRGLFLHVGLLGLPASLLGLRALGLRQSAWWGAVAIYVLGHLLIALYPDRDERSIADGAVDSIAYVVMATLTWSVLAGLVFRLGRSVLVGVRQRRFGRGAAVRTLLVGWLLAEIVSSLVVSPFPAARRALLVVAAFTVVAGWLAVRRLRPPRAVRLVAIGAVLMGLVYQAVDCLEGRACVLAAERTMAYARDHAPGANVFFTGGWGFEFYAPRAGMQPLLQGATALQKGDLIAIGSIDGAEEPWFEWSGQIERVCELGVGDPVPLSLLFHYYSGRRPLDGQVGDRFVVWIYRAVESFHSSELKPRANPWRDG